MKNKRFDFAIRLLTIVIFSGIIGCSNAPAIPSRTMSALDSLAEKNTLETAYQKIAQLAKLVQNGDLITRTGNDFTSTSLKGLNRRNKTYSHCGIVRIEHDSIFIYHALGGEWNPNQKIRKDPLSVFAEPGGNNLIGLFRYDLPVETKLDFIQKADSLYQQAIPFDMDFDLESDERMYCAEYIYKCMQWATEGQSGIQVSKINDFQFIGVDDLFLAANCRSVVEIKYR